MADGIKKSKRGRPPGSKNKAVTALVRLDKAATTAAVHLDVPSIGPVSAIGLD